MNPKFHHRGMWQVLYKVSGVLCPDGKRRTVKITGQPDTFFSVPACLTYRGKTVTGFVMSLSCPNDVQFCPTGKNKDVFPPIGYNNAVYAAEYRYIQELRHLYDARFVDYQFSEENDRLYQAEDQRLTEWVINGWQPEDQRLHLMELYALRKLCPPTSKTGGMIDRMIEQKTEYEHQEKK